MASNFLRRFMDNEAAGGVFLMLATAVALVFANTELRSVYDHFLHAHLSFSMQEGAGSISVLHFINDVLMALFFLVVGCELKRERVEGELASTDQARLPFIAALAGMLFPALIFVGINAPAGASLQGWAIPTATDIAFAVGVFALLGTRVPSGLKIFLLALAIIDDLGAILIIGLFFSHDLNLLWLMGAAVATGALWLLNKKEIDNLFPYFIVGALLWFALHHAGIHATLAGVILGFALPLKTDEPRSSPLKKVEAGLHKWVVFGILPLFAFANAGVSLDGISMADFAKPLPLGIMAGLFFGKQIGVFLAVFLAVKAGIASLPRGARWRHVHGVSLLCGIGFTMSLFIGTLAFTDPESQNYIRLGVLAGSLVSAVAGYMALRAADQNAS